MIMPRSVRGLAFVLSAEATRSTSNTGTTDNIPNASSIGSTGTPT